MKTPRFRPVRTLKGWRLNVPAALSTSGKRSRRFFKSREAADGAAIKLRSQVVGHGLATRILPPSHAEAAARSLAMLGESARPEELIEAVREYVERHNKRLASLRFEEAFDKFIASQVRSASYAQSLRQYKARLVLLHGRTLCDITAAEINSAMKDFPATVFNFGLRILGGLFNYGCKLDYCASNPIKKLDRKKLPPKEVEIYTPTDAEALLCSAEPSLIPWLGVCMFAGLRASEARQICWSNFNFEERFVRVPSTVSKTGQPRAIPMEANLEAWLLPHRGEDEKLIAPQGLNVIRTQLRTAHRTSDVKQIKHGPRHTYASYLLARDGSVDALLLNVGHEDAATTFRHYASKIATKKAAKAFWAILPKGPAKSSAKPKTNILPMQAAA
ncbi:MAG: site-specific integrase [Spartobacteria bacterium]